MPFSQGIFTKPFYSRNSPILNRELEATKKDLALMRRKALALTLILSLLFSALAGTFLIQNVARAVAPDLLQRAVANSINFFEGSREPHALLMLDVMHRRFGIAAFADALQRYDEALAERPEHAPLLRVFRRIADHDNPLYSEDLQEVSEDIDRITVPALYCDRLGLPDNYPEMLDEAARTGGYLLTHVLLAWIWIQDNGCEVPLPDGFIETMYRANAALIGDDPVVNDLELEAAAFLYLAGQGALVDDAFVERVIAVQNYDGGWLYSSDTLGDSYWHTTVLGLLLLLHVEYPADSYPPMLAPASSELPGAPSGAVPSPTDTTYANASVSLDSTFDKQTAGMGYSLEGQDNVTITGNTTLRGLANGTHQLTPSANDTEGKPGVSETITFTVMVPFPTLCIAVAVVSVAVVSASLLFYFKKRKR
jgi:hypothetical protein